MPFVGNDNVAQVNVSMLWDSQGVENTLYFFSTTPITEARLYSLAAGVGLLWQTNMMPLMSSQVILNEVNAIQLVPVPAPTAAWSPSTLIVGGDNGAAMPNNVTTTITFRTGLSGRSYRGRNYWIGITEPNVVNNTVNNGLILNILAAYALMIGPGEVDSDWTWSVYSRYVNNAPRETGLSQDVTSVGSFDNTVDSQRRRLPGRGR